MAYNNARYQRNFIRPTYEKRALPAIQPIQAIQPQQAIKPIYAARSIDEQRDTYNKNKTYLANYNDPTELNSFIDALTNTEAVSKEFGETWGAISTTSGTASLITNIAAGVLTVAAWVVSALAPDAGAIGVAGTAGAKAISGTAKAVKTVDTIKKVAKGLQTASKVLAIPAIPAATKVAYDYGIKPIMAGKPKEAGLNMLMNLGETMDAAANPVKGLFIDGPEGFVKGLGYMTDGRTNYDYDTGNFVVDMLLELISDPMNWYDIGAGTIMKKTTTKKGLEATADVASTTVAKINKELRSAGIAEISIKEVKSLEKDLAKEAGRLAKEWSNIAIDQLEDAAREQILNTGRKRLKAVLERHIKKVNPKFTNEQINNIISLAGRDVRTGRFTKSALTQIKNIQYDDLASTVIKNLSDVQQYSDDFQKALTKGAMMTSGYGLGVEAVRNGWKGIRKWSNEYTISKLVRATVFDHAKGLDIKQWDKAKGIWDACEKYTTALTGVVSQRDKHAFYAFATQQFNRDRQLINELLINNTTPAQRALAIDAGFKNLYDISFEEYIVYLKQIDASESGLFKEFVQYAEDIQTLLSRSAIDMSLGSAPKTSKQLYKAADINSLKELQNNLIADVQNAIKTSKNKIELTEKFYTLKMNDSYINALLINDTLLQVTFMKINSSDGIGAFINKILSDNNAIKPRVSAEIRDAAQYIKRAAETYQNVQKLYSDIGTLSLPKKISKVRDDQFKRYIIDEIFGFKDKPIIQLLAEFETITMPELKHKLQLLLEDVDFQMDVYPGLYEQIASTFKSFLEAQDKTGVENIEEVILKDFTKKSNTLLKHFPDFTEELADLSVASAHLGALLTVVADRNIELINSIIGDKQTIFNIRNIRKISDYGLALDTVAYKTDLDLFNIPEDVSGNIFQQFGHLGQSMNRLVERLKQYGKVLTDEQFTSERVTAITKLYEAVFKTDVLDMDKHAVTSIFKYLKPQTDPIMQFAQLHLFKKTIQEDKLLMRQLRTIPEVRVDTQLWRWICDPAPLLTTDFAWEAMSQAAWIGEKQLNKNITDTVKAYNNLGVASRKITNDFEMLKETVATNKLDRPKLLQLERYTKAANKINNMLTFLQKHYDNCFDTELADAKIQKLYGAVLHHPRFAKYADLVDRLKAYWAGELPLKQTAKYAAEQVDEFTPFWKEIKEMNKEWVAIQRSEATPAVLKEYLPKYVYQNIFEVDPTLGERVIDIMTNASRELTDDDYNLYVTVIEAMQKHLKTVEYHTQGKNYKEILWEFLPAQFKEIEFKYYYDILGIEDPRMVIELMEDTRGGWHTRTLDNIIAVLNQRDVTSFADLMQVYRHESLHNVLEKVCKTLQQRSALLFNFEEQFIQEFGDEYHDYVLERLFNAYKQKYALENSVKELSLHNHELILEELMAFTLANQLVSTDFLKALDAGQLPLTIVPTNLKSRMTTFSETLVQQLEQMAQENGLRSTINYEDFLDRKTSKTSQRLTDFEIVTPWDPVRKQQELNKAINKATDQNAKGKLYKLVNLTAEQFEQELAFRHRFVTFTQADVSEGQLHYMYKRFEKVVEKNEHIHHFYDKETQRHWFVLDKNQRVNASGRQYYLNGNALTRVQDNARFDEFMTVDKIIDDKTNPGIVDTLNELDNTLEELTGSRLGDSQGEFLDEKALKQIYTQMPEEVQNLIDIDDITNKQFFEAYAFNESVLGTANSKRALGMASGNMITNTSNMITQAQCYLKPKVEYVHAVFDSQFSISNSNGIYKGFSDNDLLEALQNTSEYVLVALTDHKKYGMRVTEILPTSLKAIQKAKEVGAVIIPRQTYKDMYNVVNHRLGSSGFAKLWNRIMYVYKSGYLLRPGAWIRNFVDTNLKSYLEMGDEYKSYSALSHKILNDVDCMKEYIRKRTKELTKSGDDIHSIAKMQQEWFDNKSAKYLTYEQFLELDRDFLSQAISGNIMSDLYTGKGGDLWRMYTQVTGYIVDKANKTENYNRLATYLYRLDKGDSYTTALSKLAKTHFDYGFKTMAEQLIDMVFPFATFSMRNYSYWIEMIETYPWIARNYVHLMKPSWDFQDYTPEQLATDYRAQNQIMSGQLKLGEFNDKLITFKANPSIQDALQMFSDPINNIYEKLAAPISTPLKMATEQYVQPTNLIPLLGPAIQSIQTALKTGSPMPSAIGVTKQSKRSTKVNFKNKNLSGINQYRDSNYKTPKYRNNIVFDSYKTIGMQRYRLNMYPVIDIAHEVKSRYTTNVYAKIKNRVQTDVYKGIRYRLKLDVNRFR